MESSSVLRNGQLLRAYKHKRKYLLT